MEYVIVGSGLTGATIATQIKIWKPDAKLTVLEKRNHIGGNVYTEFDDGIHVHKYGPHIFHTNSSKIWSFINQFGKFHNYQHRVKVAYGGVVFSFPINLQTFNEVMAHFGNGTFAPKDMYSYFKSSTDYFNNMPPPKNLEEKARRMVPNNFYQIFFEGYTKKQWNKDPKDLPQSIISRIPVRYNYDDRYFDDRYQGIPVDGYTKLIERMLYGVDIITNCNFTVDSLSSRSKKEKIIYTGPIDQFFEYTFGPLEYRSLRFEEKKLPIDDFQGISQMNYTDVKIPYTRIIEHKHFDYGCQNTESTILTYEYPQDYKPGENEPFYPINDEMNNERYKKYIQFAKEFFPDIIFCGRLGSYKYYNMDQAIGQALTISERILRE